MVTLTRWLSIMGFNPWFSYQLSNSRLLPITSSCNQLTYEFAWQNGERAGRSEIRRSIQRAEELFLQYADFYPRKHFNTAIIPYPKLGDIRYQRYRGTDNQNHWLSVQLPEGKVHEIGYEHITLVSNRSVAYTDVDGDGIYETATVVATVPAGTTNEMLYVTFASSDYLPTQSDMLTQIYPMLVSVVGTTATLTFNTFDLVRPILYTLPNAQQLDLSVLPPSAVSPFAATVNVSTRFCDPNGTTQDTAQAVLIWETTPCPDWATLCWGTQNTPDPAAYAYAIARVGIRDINQGIVYLGEAVYDTATEQWVGHLGFSHCRPPDRVLIRYYAGADNNNTDTVVARLAAAELARPICACAPANKELQEWQQDVMRTGLTDEVYSPPDDASNPLGSRRGHIFAWRHIQQAMRLIGIWAG